VVGGRVPGARRGGIRAYPRPAAQSAVDTLLALRSRSGWSAAGSGLGGHILIPGSAPSPIVRPQCKCLKLTVAFTRV
jgi:hypothetical protein